MKKGAWEFESIAKLLLYLLLAVVLIGLIYYFKDMLLEKFEIIKDMVKIG